MVRTWLKRLGIFLLTSVMLEIFVFNYRAIVSFNATDQHLDVIWTGDGYFASDGYGKPNYIYVGIESAEEGQEPVTGQVGFTVFLKDEGNAESCELGEVQLCPLVEKDKYLRIHSYGDVYSIHIVPDEDSMPVMRVSEVIYDARVPWFFSPLRVVGMVMLLCLGTCLRPESSLYIREWKNWQKRCAVAVLLGVNLLAFYTLAKNNPAFLEPKWLYHKQYQELAVSLSRGKVTINEGREYLIEALEQLENPYDTKVRMATVPGADRVWDICYYGGNFYVYFGIVPELLFYLPYYLIKGGPFPTWFGVFVTGSMAIGGVYYLLAQVRRKWFPQSPFLWYLILAVIMGNGMQLASAMLHADFYYLPILTALALCLWGLGLVLSASGDFSGHQGKYGGILKLAAGSLFLALTAGCRPQFLVGSFLILPVLLPILWTDLWSGKTGSGRSVGKAVLRLTAIAVPYLLVAAGVMYYNYIRFGSVFDFGANYNLTTNDMTKRGFEMGRLPDGLFMYLFQPPAWKLQFPFVEVTNFYSDYLGETIRDWTYGGVFWTHAILIVLAGVILLRKDLKKRKVYGFTILSAVMALVVIVADTEMAGILNRYYTDFLWLLMLPAMIVLLQLWERGKGASWYRFLVLLVLVACVGQLLCELGIAVRGSGIMSDNPYVYYSIRALLP
ncbi:MAG: hypothetical protein IJ794_11240 [Lachnospiraceae bacterium]|nr:hypothetical protein [Lachnospiraceae bacterium]